MDSGIKDPIFGSDTPLVFSHRGGAGEAPESTEEAFRHSVENAGVDVLELDIQVTKDGEIIVWHGPGLDIVHDGRRFLKGRDIREELFYQDLKDRAWVIHPNHLNDLEQKPTRRLLTLSDFIALVNQIEDESNDTGNPKKTHLNIELKKGHHMEKEWTAVWDRLFEPLDAETGKRRIVLASAEHKILESLRNEMARPGRKTYVTNLSINEQLSFRRFMPSGMASLFFKAFAPFIYKPEEPAQRPYAFETYFKLASKTLAEKVREDQSGLYLFLTGIFLFPSVDNRDDTRLKKIIGHLVDAGVDGIMTDYPAKVVQILREMGIRE